MFCLIFKHESIGYLYSICSVVSCNISSYSYFIYSSPNDCCPIWIPIQSCLRPHLDSTPIVDNSIHIVFLPPYPLSYITPYILPYLPPYFPPYQNPSIFSVSSFIIIPIPRATTIIHMILTFSPIITIHLPPFPRLRLPHHYALQSIKSTHPWERGTHKLIHC